MTQRHAPQCPIESALAVIGGRWKIVILCRLFRGVCRFNELRRSIESISQRMLAQQLRELERDGMVERRAHPGSLQRVEYALTDFGRTLEPALDLLWNWGEAFQGRRAARAPSALRLNRRTRAAGSE